MGLIISTHIWVGSSANMRFTSIYIVKPVEIRAENPNNHPAPNTSAGSTKLSAVGRVYYRY